MAIGSSSMQDVAFGLKPLAHISNPREVVRQFTPNWFAATMGTGVLALVLPQFAATMPILRVIGEALWFFNMGLFVLFSALYIARWLMFFDEARKIFGHSVVSMFFGCIPMGLATIINGFVIFGAPLWGQVAVDLAEILWWIDLAMAVVCGVTIPFMMFTRQQHSVEQMSAVWLLPVVACEVTAASGGLLAPHLATPFGQLLMVVLSYISWALSVPLAMSILVILVLRMAVHKLPPVGLAASSWLALGPIGTGALAMLNLGSAAPPILAAHGIEAAAAVAQGTGQVVALLLWGYGMWWMITASLITSHYLRGKVPFNLGWWGYTFPIGVYTLTTLRLEVVYPIHLFGVLGAILSLALVTLWIVIAWKTARGAWRGDLFVAPCLKAQ